MNDGLKAEIIAALKRWLERLDYSDPYLDKPMVKALLEKLENSSSKTGHDA